MAKKIEKTNAARLLDKSGIKYSLIPYEFDENDLAAIRHLLYETETSADLDATVQSIIQEELSAYRAGIRSLEETQNILQSRLWIYINE